MGLSLGGLVPASYASVNPGDVRRIAFAVPAYRQFPPPGLPERLSEIRFALSQQHAMAEGQSTDFLDPSRFPDWIDRYKIQGFRHSRISTFYNFTTIDHQENFRFRATTDKPILLLWCEHDVTLPFIESRVVAEITGAEFNPVAQAAHVPHSEQPQIVNPIIVEFFLQKMLESVD